MHNMLLGPDVAQHLHTITIWFWRRSERRAQTLMFVGLAHNWRISVSSEEAPLQVKWVVGELRKLCAQIKQYNF